MTRRQPGSTRTYTLVPSTTLFRSLADDVVDRQAVGLSDVDAVRTADVDRQRVDRRFNRVGGRHQAVARQQAHALARVDARPEENTSELQSLMRSSYAVFCLKKKTYNSRVT